MFARLSRDRVIVPDTDLAIAGEPFARALEPLHLLLAGTTGTGKSTCIAEIIERLRARGDRLLVCDPNGSYAAIFARQGDRLLNPFDVRSPGWSIFNELMRDFDADRLARSVVPDGTGEAAAWHHYAQVLLAELLRALVRRGETTTERLLYWSGSSTTHELGKLLSGTSAAAIFDADAGKALASTRFVLAMHLAPHRYVPPGDFSLRRWLLQDRGSMFLTWRADMQSALAPLTATFVDVFIGAILALPPDRDRRIWLVIDELAAIGRLNSLELALTLGRKHGLCVIAGLQSTAQLDRLYGRNSATTLRACFRNLLVLGIAKTDPDTCEALSRALGEQEVLRDEESCSSGMQGISRSFGARRSTERLVLPSEIADFQTLPAFLRSPATAPLSGFASRRKNALSSKTRSSSSSHANHGESDERRCRGRVLRNRGGLLRRGRTRVYRMVGHCCS